jgi:hypothetical protein
MSDEEERREKHRLMVEHLRAAAATHPNVSGLLLDAADALDLAPPWLGAPERRMIAMLSESVAFQWALIERLTLILQLRTNPSGPVTPIAANGNAPPAGKASGGVCPSSSSDASGKGSGSGEPS